MFYVARPNAAGHRELLAPTVQSLMRALSDSDLLWALLRRRRVTRLFSDARLPRQTLTEIASVVSYAPTGGGRRQVRTVVVDDQEQLRRILAVSPGVVGLPAALIVLCIDWTRAPHLVVDDPREVHSMHLDVGAAMENILLISEALKVGACPVMSFHRAAVAASLNLPAEWTPVIQVALGIAGATASTSRGAPARPNEFHWNGYEPSEPSP